MCKLVAQWCQDMRNTREQAVLQEAQRCLRASGQRIVLGGNYVSGVALGRCLEAGPDTAEQLALLHGS